MKSASTDSKTSERPLDGIAVGISVAYGEDSAQRGFTVDEMNSSVVRLADGLLAAGARLVFGHDWRPNGVMAAVADLAIRYEPASPPIEGGLSSGPCRITNLVPWDSRAELPAELRRDLEARGILRVEEIPLPESLTGHGPQWSKRTLRAAALCRLRQRLAELCDARVCLGGKYAKYEGFWPGILEEAWTSAKQEQPVFLSGMLGGAASRVLEASRTKEGNALTWANPDDELRRELAFLRESKVILLPDFTDFHTVMNWTKLQTMSGLDGKDWQRLSEATDIEVITALVLKGLRRIRAGN